MDKPKYYYHPSKFVYYLRWIIPEFICLYHLYLVSRYLIYYFGHCYIPFHFIILFIMLILTIDIIDVIRICIQNDLEYYLQFDLKYRSLNREYLPYYSQYRHTTAYIRYFHIDVQLLCGICLYDYKYNKNEDISLLPCGHIFHEECLSEYENKSHHNNPFQLCPFCRLDYDSTYEKYQFDNNYRQDINNLTLLEIPLSYPGNKILYKYIWSNVYEAYIRHIKSIWRKNYRSMWLRNRYNLYR